MDGKAVRSCVLVLFIVCLILKDHTSLGVDTLSVGQSLSGDQTIFSAKGVYELGFFKPGNSSKYYLGIWYKGVKLTVPWVANREKPLTDKFSAELRLSEGNLVLFDESKNPIWSTNAPPSNSSSVRAVILDNGNLVLRDGPGNSSEPLWESFDYPTDTWLPEGKIGFNNRTGEKYSFTSWKSLDDPAPGLFTFVPVANDNIVLWNNTVQYWSTGTWDPNDRVFNGIPEMRANHYYDFKHVSNENESYYTYIVINGEFSRFVMDYKGQMQQRILDNKALEWNIYWTQPRHQCDVHAFCGSFGSCNENPSPSCSCLTGFQPALSADWASENFLGGCVRRTQLSCGAANNATAKPDKFLRKRGVVYPEKGQSVQQAVNAAACELACLNNCSCNAYSFDSGACTVWTVDLINLQQLRLDDERGKVISIRLAASELKHKNRTGLFVGAAAGSAAASLGLLGVVLFFANRRKKTRRVRVAKAMEGSLVAFEYRDLQSATKNFSDKLGGGGFGSVFKGTLTDSSMVAVKKLENIGQGEKEFRAEVATIGAIQHVNLVRLRGFCSEGIHKLLVYDYMSNGSLSSNLFAQKSPNVLDWKARYQIALGTARGLVYLHEKCRDCIIHCDIKPENILLDQELLPKVADFGLAKLVGRDFSRVLTTIRGTIGYLAPEWIAGVAVTPKADVYSYGMMLFEIVSGRRNSENSEPDSKAKYFPTLATKVVIEGNGELVSLLDPRLEGKADVEELGRLCKVAYWCIQDDESHRPSMSQVVQILEGITEVNVPPVPRSLHFFDAN